jgi:hypothetical protein
VSTVNEAAEITGKKVVFSILLIEEKTVDIVPVRRNKRWQSRLYDVYTVRVKR